jgi:flavin-dependent dehydrogenase
MTPQVHSHLMSPWGCGWHVDRVAFDRMLAQAAQSAGAVLLCGMAFRHRDDAENDSALTLIERSDDGSPRELHLRARVIVDATGRRARLARSFGAQRLLFDRLIAVATLFDGMDVAREGYVVVETAREGWWYSAPVPAGRMMAMLMTDSDVCGRADLFSAPVWHDRLQAAQATRARTAAGTPLWGPRVFSAISQRLRRSEYRGHWLAVGDAALATDPVAGNGVVRALRSARAGAETALALLEGKAESALRQYEDDRDRECDSYLHERAAYYGIERRWQQSVFWQRRLRAAA